MFLHANTAPTRRRVTITEREARVVDPTPTRMRVPPKKQVA
jgi:hypothetical protein